MDYEFCVNVCQEGKSCVFFFVKLCDAMEFAGTCIECGVDGTEIRITREKED